MKPLYWFGLIVLGIILHLFPAYNLSITVSLAIVLAVVGVIGLIKTIL